MSSHHGGHINWLYCNTSVLLQIGLGSFAAEGSGGDRFCYLERPKAALPQNKANEAPIKPLCNQDQRSSLSGGASRRKAGDYKKSERDCSVILLVAVAASRSPLVSTEPTSRYATIVESTFCTAWGEF